MIRVELMRAWPRRSEAVAIELDDAARVADALDAAHWALDGEFTGLAIFGLPATVDTALHDGDRIELLRGLQMDPKQARRRRAERSR